MKLAVTDPVLLDFAEEVGPEGPVAIVGSKTRWDLGGSLDPETRLLSAPTGIVEYYPDEMIVKVRCGTPVAELHAALAEKGQRTALPERGGTVGGALAVGQSCLQSRGRGRTREALLQIRYVSAEGKVVTGGGPTVKNASGFDLPRLMVGSLGTLGLLTEAILRTNPFPPMTRRLVTNDADPFAVNDMVWQPSMILWDGTQTFVELEGQAQAVEAEIDRLSALGTWEETDDVPARPKHRWSLTPAQLKDAPGMGHGTFVASIGVGTLWSTEPQPERSLDPVAVLINQRMKEQFDPTGRLSPGRSVIPGGGS